MKVVLFCGGLGMRIRDYPESVPKPMIKIGYRPILWHVMKYYAHFGHKEFILCLGYKAEVVKDYFLNYQETLSNDFVLRGAARDVELLNRDIDDWTITFVDTGASATIGERLQAVRRHVGNDEVFLANYSDGVSDLALDRYLADVLPTHMVASFLSVRPNLSLHAVSSRQGGWVSGIQPLAKSNLRINGGFFVLRREIFDYLRPGEELVGEAFERLIQRGALLAYEYEGFWAAMDTFKDREWLEELWRSGKAPWILWGDGRLGGSAPAASAP
jgi:glucose-1-phosphate cytidylyltransferase